MQSFRAAIEGRDVEAAAALLSPGVSFRSPVVFHPYEGRDAVRAILTAVMEVFEDFAYVSELASTDGREHALLFRARIGDRELEGCDFLHENADGLIDEFVVMVRPLTAAHALAEGMRAHFEGAVPSP